ncbi:ferredoxin-thioredoxin reductase variable chain [Myxacorys almedinensis]
MVKAADRGTLHIMEIGARVRVKESVVIYHHPQHRNQPFDLQGEEGEVIAIVTEWRGRPVSANFPVLVKIGTKLRVHLQEAELEII